MGVTPARRLRDLERSEALREEGRKENEAKFTEFRVGCESGIVAACNSLGEWYALMRQDFATAMQYYTPTCFKHRHPQSCLNYGLVAANGRGGVPQSISSAVSAFTIGCEEKNADACVEGGRLLLSQSVAMTKGEAAKVESAKVESLRTSGEAVAEAARLFRIGCETGAGAPSAKSCGLLGALLLSGNAAVTARDPMEPVTLLTTACDGEHVHSCFKLAKLYRHGGFGVPIDVSKAEEFEKKGLAWSGMTNTRLPRKVSKE